MPDRAQVEAAVMTQLSPERAAHVGRVAAEAVALARRFGADADAALWAGLLHDWCKEVPARELVALARATGVLSPDTSDADVLVGTLHGPVAARLLPQRWPELRSSVLAAIDRHTTGDVDMSDLDCVLYCADLIEPDRRFPGVDALRALAREDLWRATLAGMDATLRDLVDRGRRIDPRAVAARNAMLVRLAPGGPTAKDLR